MKFITGLLQTYRTGATSAWKTLFRGWAIIPAIILIHLTLNAITYFLSQLPLGFAGGLLYGLLDLCMITLVYQWLLLISEPRYSTKTHFKEFAQFDGELFINIINAAYPIFLAEFFISSLVLNIHDLSSIPAYLKLGIVFLFNPLPEVILINRPYGLSALSEALTFVKNHVIEWFLPMILLCSPVFFFNDLLESFQFIILKLAGSEVLMPIEFTTFYLGQLLLGIFAILGISSSSIYSMILAMLCSLAIGCWFGLFRLELFKRLQRS